MSNEQAKRQCLSRKSEINMSIFSEEELEKFRKDFMIDSSKDQTSKQVFVETFAKLVENPNATTMATNLFSALDLHNKGFVSTKEIIYTLSIMSARSSEDDKLRLAYNVCDIYKNGYLVREEVRLFLSALFKMSLDGHYEIQSTTVEKTDLLWGLMDPNNTGRANFEEFKNALMQDSYTHAKILDFFSEKICNHINLSALPRLLKDLEIQA